MCRECDDELFVSLSALNRHVRNNHTESRVLNNLQLVENFLFSTLGEGYTSDWADGLAFLRTLDLEPPTFRQPLTTKIKYRLEETICDTFALVIETCNEALKAPRNPKYVAKCDYDPWAILQLAFLFERLVLFPLQPSDQSNKSNTRRALNTVIHERLRKFKQGKIRELYEEAAKVKSKTPNEQSANPPSISKAAQAAADVDNFKSANARITKHAPVAKINGKNIETLQNLHPPSLDRKCIKPRKSTRNGGTRRKLQVTSFQIVEILTKLHRGKAPGLQCDSLDLYIKLAKRIRLSDPKGLRQARSLASFFQKIINGEVPTKFKHFLRTTYLVALEKDPDDKTKLRPLGVPSAIRRIAAIIVIKQYSATFAEHILPFNYAIGISGGCDVIVKTLQLAVDKYIIDKENNNELPSRCLVSLDIRNMFNAISRERLREVIAEKFPSLEPFADLIYDGAGETFVKLEDGSWTVIPVVEGFSQGCPASPVFAAIVLNEILTVLQSELNNIAAQRLANGDKGDDGLGSLGLILAYVDDVNSLLHHDDVGYFMRRFVELAEPLGAILNTEKTRILTTTTGQSLVQKLIKHPNLDIIRRGKILEQTIATYSREKVDGAFQPCEVVSGLRVLGCPVGSHSFCRSFINKTLAKAMSDASMIRDNLENIQTMLRLYSTCTVHKLTHLFSSDVLNSPTDDLPHLFYTWESEMTEGFTSMTDEMITSITNTSDLPPHSHIMSNLSIKQGGLGLQHPRLNAITSYMMSTKRCLQYVKNGVWLGTNKPQPMLPDNIQILYSNWEKSSNRNWVIFNKYLPTFTSICCQRDTPNNDFIFKSSINNTRDKAKEYASRMIVKNVLLDENFTPASTIKIMPALLDRRASMALMTMSRLEEAHRMTNEVFQICLKRKLRLPIFSLPHTHHCKCGKALDIFGDHSLGCKANSKTRASNGIRDGFIRTFQRVLKTARLIDSDTQVECEPRHIVPSLPQLQPFDLSIRLDHSLDPGSWRIPFKRIGFDVTIIHSSTNSSSTPSEAAQYCESDLRLRYTVS